VNVVIDASAIVAVVLQEADTALVEATRRTLRNADQIAPALMPIEVAGAIAMAEWSGRRSASDTDAAWHIAGQIVDSVDVMPTENVERLFALCRRHRLRGADAAYLNLSIDRGAPLLTGDKKLAAAATAADVPLIYDPNL